MTAAPLTTTISTDSRTSSAALAPSDVDAVSDLDMPVDPFIEGYASPTSSSRKPDRLYHGIILAICVAVLTLAATMRIRDSRQVLAPIFGRPLPELCHFRRLTGIDCPGCGMTRSFISLAHGRLADAWRYNPASLLLFPVFVFQLPYRGLQMWRVRRGLPELKLGWLPQATLFALVVLMVGQWLVRQFG